MGTVVTIDVYEGAAPRGLVLGLARARAALHAADATFSTYREHSPMNLVRTGELDVAAAPVAIGTVLELCATVRDLSEGWFDPWAMPGGVDPTGLVKGWAAEQALGVLATAGATVATVNAGGDICALGLPDGATMWRFGVQDPFDAAGLAAVVEVRRAIATSGVYARGAHLVDPHAHRARAAAVSATVVGDDLAVADGLATALATAGASLLPAIVRAGYEGFVIDADGRREATTAFPFAGDVGTG